jgi:hypothetical protein
MSQSLHAEARSLDEINSETALWETYFQFE